jgi:succinylglutamic semialdehyde dehydrogenase
MTNLYSINPATGEYVWRGKTSSSEEVQTSIQKAQSASKSWRKTPFEERAEYAKTFASLLSDEFAIAISKEMGKPLWEAKAEVSAMKNKAAISIAAYQDRCKKLEHGSSSCIHKPHGVVTVFGPFNFPGHLPNGHIIPALLAGNTVVFKPSELTPGVGEMIDSLWKKAGLPDGVFNLVQGGKEVGHELVSSPHIRGIFFTGSVAVGRRIQEASFQYPNRILALEMGGNNPLIISSISSIEAAVFTTIQSTFITSGQRCSCSKRLIIIENHTSKAFIKKLIDTTKSLMIAPYTTNPEPYMGPVVSKQAADTIMNQYNNLPGKKLLELKRFDTSGAFLSPAIVDVTGYDAKDEEIFGPVMQLTRVKNLDEAIKQANNSSYGLCAGIISDDAAEYERVLDEVNAGVINWNTPTTGASSHLPFGGIGLSGNFRPSAYYAADYSAYPIASTILDTAILPETLPPGYPCLK